MGPALVVYTKPEGELVIAVQRPMKEKRGRQLLF
jgi:hypothetical protein